MTDEFCHKNWWDKTGKYVVVYTCDDATDMLFEELNRISFMYLNSPDNETRFKQIINVLAKKLHVSQRQRKKKTTEQELTKKKKNN